MKKTSRSESNIHDEQEKKFIDGTRIREYWDVILLVWCLWRCADDSDDDRNL